MNLMLPFLGCQLGKDQIGGYYLHVLHDPVCILRSVFLGSTVRGFRAARFQFEAKPQTQKTVALLPSGYAIQIQLPLAFDVHALILPQLKQRKAVDIRVLQSYVHQRHNLGFFLKGSQVPTWGVLTQTKIGKFLLGKRKA